MGIESSKKITFMAKIDLKKEQKALYAASAREVKEVTVPPLAYLMIDGEGDPNHAASYAQAIEALYSVSYTVKFALKRRAESIDYAVMPLEGLWWADDHSVFLTGDKSQWKWTMMIQQPSFVAAADLDKAIAQVWDKKQLAAVKQLRFETYTEGRCAQIMHVGPFSEEGPTIARVHEFIASRGKLRGKHHEIYLSDVRRAHPSKWKTIIRQPMELAP